MQKSYFPYAKQTITSSDIEAVAEVMKQDKITRGEKTKAFEEATAGYVGAKWAVSFNSATSALFAAFFAAEASEKDRFVTTPNTFIATAGAAMKCGIKPQFVDIDLGSGNMDIELLKPFFDAQLSRGRLIIAPVHFAGIAIDMKRLDRMIKNPNTVVIEDAAHAIGSKYPSGEMVGSCSYSQMTIFSFHPAKTITSGEGGMVTTNDDALYQRLLLYRNNGIDRSAGILGFYDVVAITGNFHMTEMQAALGLSQLMRLHTIVEKRRALVAAYRRELASKPHIKLFDEKYDANSAYHLMVAQIDFQALNTTNEAYMRKLHDKGIGTDRHYIPLYRHSVLKKDYPDVPFSFPKMAQYESQALTLPLYYDLSEEDVQYISSQL